MKIWKHLLDNEKMESELKGMIIGVNVQMQSSDLYFSLNLATRPYADTDSLAKSM